MTPDGIIEEFIEEMVAALPADSSERDKHIFREALRGLVRLARVEQTLAINRDFEMVNRVAHPGYKRSA